jgi:hypothetical protein
MVIKGRSPSRRADRGQHDRHTDEGDPNVSNWLVIPYFPGDQGRQGTDRPLPSNVISWLCPSIVVNGQPGKNSFVRGEVTSVTVNIVNLGKGTTAAPVYVRIWWADPCTAFAKLNPFGQAVALVPSDGQVRTTESVTGIIPTWAPPHVCLLVHVSSPIDPGKKTPPNPNADRHWAQFNIAEVEIAGGQPFQFFFNIYNPLETPASFEIAAVPLRGEKLETFGRVARRALGNAEDVRLGLRHQRGEHGGVDRQADSIEVVLEPGRARLVGVEGQVPSGVEPGTGFAFDIIQRERRDGGFEGTLGLVAIVGRER